MSGPIIEKVKLRCDESASLIQAIGHHIPVQAPCCRRHDFARLAIDLSREHHRGIVRLIYAGELGSAAALLRPQLEAATSAFWLTYAASESQVNALPTDPADHTAAADIPMLGEMAHALLPIFPAIEKMVEGLGRNGSRSLTWLHKYTHGGTAQLVRRDQANSWSVGDALLMLRRADMFGVLGASVEAPLSRDSGFANFIYGQRNRLGREITEAYSLDPIPMQPPLPDPSLPCCCASIM